MECAGRGLAFYSYQVTQEVYVAARCLVCYTTYVPIRVYQEYLAKGLTDKTAVLNTQMDQIINDANGEILRLRNKLAAVEIDQEDLRKKNHELSEAYNQKSQAHQKSQKMYDVLKKRTLQSDVRYAAEDAVGEQMVNTMPMSQHAEGFSTSQRQTQQYPVDHRGIEQLHSRQRSGSSGDEEQNSKPFQKPRAVYGQSWNGQGRYPRPSVLPFGQKLMQIRWYDNHRLNTGTTASSHACAHPVYRPSSQPVCSSSRAGRIAN
jgi:DNA-binding protein H-NS